MKCVCWRSVIRLALAIFVGALPVRAAVPEYSYRVQEGDVLSIDIALRGSLGDLSKLSGLPLEIVGESVFSHHAVTITPDGLLFLPGMTSIKVTGLTLSEIEQAVASGLHMPVNRNYVSVALSRTNSLSLYVWGEVKKPGRYLIDHPMNLMEALSEAGGPTEKAKVKRVVLIRQGEKALEVDLSLKHLQEMGPSTVMLKPYDTVFVPRKWSVSEFFIYGLLTAVGTASSVYVASKAR